MKIYSWNMLFSNRRRKAALTFIRRADFDVFCLQEVPETFLPRLQELPFEIAFAPEIDRGPEYHPRRVYLVILSKYPIRDPQRIPLPDHSYPFHIRAYLTALALLRLRRRATGNRHNLFADIETPHGLARVFCVHLPLTYPSMRLEEFDLSIAYRDPSIPTIICGDFNILETFYSAVFNWLLGGSWRDAISKRRERKMFEDRFSEHKFTNAHPRRSTHAFSRSQLDHILVPESFDIRAAEVIRRSYGSDHRPIFAEIVPHT